MIVATRRIGEEVFIGLILIATWPPCSSRPRPETSPN